MFYWGRFFSLKFGTLEIAKYSSLFLWCLQMTLRVCDLERSQGKFTGRVVHIKQEWDSLAQKHQHLTAVGARLSPAKLPRAGIFRARPSKPD